MILRHTSGFYWNKLVMWKSQFCGQLQVPYNTADLHVHLLFVHSTNDSHGIIFS